MATTQEKITALYIAYFGRAPDYEGLEFWLDSLSSKTFKDEKELLTTISDSFAQHPQFTQLYADLSNQAFVESIYINVLGNSGDSEGIAYWSDLLDRGVSRSDMVADFVTSVLDFDPTNYPKLSQSELDLATQRADLLANKVAVSLDYTYTLKEQTNITNTQELEDDAAYKASIKIISDVTDQPQTKDDAKTVISELATRDDAIVLINEMTQVTPVASTQLIAKTDLSTTATNMQVDFYTTGVKELINGTEWQSSTITYSFNKTPPSDYYTYPEGGLTDGFTPLDAQQRDAVKQIMRELDALLSLSFVEVQSGGDIAFNIVDMDATTAGFSFNPGNTYSYEGDIFLSSAFNTDPQNFGLNPGQNGWLTIVHELGHALGLKHPFEGTLGIGYDQLPPELDDTNHTVMSYTNRYDITPELTYSADTVSIHYPITYTQLYGLYDVAALDYIYGLEQNYNAQENIYTFSFADGKPLTIVDQGGDDILDLSSTTGADIIDLTPGSVNSADVHTLDEIIKLYQDDLHAHSFYTADSWISTNLSDLYLQEELFTGKDALTISAESIIEDISTGLGDDLVKDNFVDNVIQTAAGDDGIYLGSGGYDSVDGGSGIDTLYLPDNAFTLEQLTDEVYLLVAQDYAAELQNIEYIGIAQYIPLSIDNYLI
jgi:hypothetical protein